jgi:hypothetical protein
MPVMTESQRARFHDVLREVMADRNRFHVISSRKRWIVLSEDTEKRMGAFVSKTEAIERARALAVPVPGRVGDPRAGQHRGKPRELSIGSNRLTDCGHLPQSAVCHRTPTAVAVGVFVGAVHGMPSGTLCGRPGWGEGPYGLKPGVRTEASATPGSEGPDLGNSGLAQGRAFGGPRTVEGGHTGCLTASCGPPPTTARGILLPSPNTTAAL